MKTLLHFWILLSLALLPAQGQGLLSLAGSPPAAGGGGPTLVASDNFDAYADADQLELQSGWTSVNGGVDIEKAASDGSTFGATQGMVRSTATFSGNQRSVATCELLTPGSFAFVCVGVRCQAGADTRYWIQSDGTNWYLVHRVAGSQSVLASGTHSITSGARLALEASGTSTATRLTAQVYTGGSWSNITGAVNIDPGSGKYIDGGTPGIGGDGASSTDARGDEWEGYNL